MSEARPRYFATHRQLTGAAYIHHAYVEDRMLGKPVMACSHHHGARRSHNPVTGETKNQGGVTAQACAERMLRQWLKRVPVEQQTYVPAKIRTIDRLIARDEENVRGRKPDRHAMSHTVVTPKSTYVTNPVLAQPLRVLRRPTRGELLRVVGELQTLVGMAKGAYENDRDPNREHSVRSPLDRAFELCIEALHYDPPRPRSRRGGLRRDSANG